MARTWLSGIDFGPSRLLVFSPFFQRDESLAILAFVIPYIHRDLCFRFVVLMEFPSPESNRFHEF
jgi:hypothetical protein